MLLAAAALAGDRMLVEAMLVRVNDRILTVSDFGTRLRLELSQSQAPPSEEALRGFARQVFEAVVDEMILLERADEKRITVDDEMLDNAIANLREENDLQDDEMFEQALQSAGLTVQALRERYRRSILIQRAAQSEINPTEITGEELLQRYEADKERYRVPAKVELEQLFFPVAADGSDRESVLQRARGLVERVRSGNDMRAEATLAGIQVQDLGAIPEADLRPELRAVLQELEEGGITDPLDTGGGLQVIRLVRRIPAGFQQFEEVKESIRRQMSLESYEQQTRGVVERLRGEYLVVIHEDRLSQFLESIVLPA
jgi:parvulin-like peptidyl-prolyl isomerase